MSDVAEDSKPGNVLHTIAPELAECWSALIQEVDRGELKLPLLPQVASQVIELANDPSADMGELAALIQKDQALAGHVLRISNSAAFGGGQVITSLQQAVTRLGMRFLADAALAVSLKGELFTSPEFKDYISGVWKHALAAGVYGKEIARIRRANVECQYLCGLLHTIGKPVALRLLDELHRRHGWQTSNEGLQTLVEAAHTQLGSRLARDWELPAQVEVVCQYHLVPDQASQFEEECAMTYLANRSALWIMRADGAGEQSIRQDSIMTRLNLYPDEIDELFSRRDDVESAVNALNV